MSDNNRAGISGQRITALQTLVDKILSAPEQWVLFLGSDAFVNKSDDCGEIFSKLANHACSVAPASAMAEKILRATQENNLADLSTALFGCAWDGATFLNEDRVRNVKLREQYAEKLPSKDEINVYAKKEKWYLRKLIRRFRGIILTPCQDDTVEAFWEYENSLPAESIVHTPQLIAGSNDWSRWLHTTGETAFPRFRNKLPPGSAILVKLFGSRDEYEKMLLSQEDLDAFYPKTWQREAWGGINTILFLERIFCSRNVLFIGVNLENDWLLNAATGILALLEKAPSDMKRIAIHCENFDTEKYHIRTLDDISADDVDATLPGEPPERTDESEENILSQEEEILELFWRFYNRRPRRPFIEGESSHTKDGAYNMYDMEYKVLKRDVLDISGDTPRKWRRQDIRQLAIAANNFSDFYDLRDAMELVKGEDGETYAERIPRLLSSRFSKKSLLLYQILRRYESGFPTGFLQLLPKEEYGLKSWRRAGIQLANSGVYVQRNGKQRLYERMRYADCVMRTAGKSLFQTRIQNEIDAISCRSMHSYLYPFHDIEIAGSDMFEEAEINKHFTQMFSTLYEILRDKSEEYQQIYALLQTELPAIVKTIRTLPDENLAWKPGLLYYLLLESQVGMKQNSELLEYCNDLLRECQKRLDSHSTDEQLLFCEVLMLHQAKALIMSQSFDKKKQKEAGSEYWAVESLIMKDYAEKPVNEIPSDVFMNRIGACFLRIMSLGRRSTIWEIERCKDERRSCPEQLLLLDNMKSSLDSAVEIIKGREDALGKQYTELRGKLARLMGEYYFKMSQYYGENRRYGEEDAKGLWAAEEKVCYQLAKKEYEKALEYYKRSPTRYWVQHADIMRSMGDLYCHWMRCVDEITAAGVEPGKSREELTKECYENLINAYVSYRSHSDLHGIADVLQSMGQAESYITEKANERPHRSHLSYYKASVDLYEHLGDAWSRRVAQSFLDGCFHRSHRPIEVGPVEQ